MLFRKIIPFIAGPQATTFLEERIFNLSSFVITFFCLQSAIINYVIGLHYMTYVLAITGSLISASIYVSSRKFGHFSDRLLLLYAISTVVILGPLHFYNGGVNGTIMYLNQMLLTVFLIASKRTFFSLYVIIMAGLLTVLTIELYIPSFVVPYRNFGEQMTDHIIVLIYVSVFTSLVIYLFRESYQRDRLQLQEQKTELEKSRQEIARKNQHITALFQDMHHRIKNNMQIASSIMEMQSFKSSDTAIRQAIDSSILRLNAINLIHQKLQISDENATLSLKDYTEELIEQLFTSLQDDEDHFLFSAKIEINRGTFPMDKALLVGLIINELTTNAYKHGRSQTGAGELNVSLADQDEETMILRVSDSGSKAIDLSLISKGETMGMRLITSIVSQLNAQMDLQFDQGNIITISIPVR